jgi:hypothetical protein
VKDRLHVFLQPGALPDQLRTPCDPPVQRLTVIISDSPPCRKRRQQPRGCRDVHLVGLDLRLAIARVFNEFGTITRATRSSSSLTIACVLHVASLATSSVGANLSAKTRSSSEVVLICPA